MSKRKNKKFPKQPKEYKVGYCKPPEAYKWQKGCKSPNPSGRPKKVKNLQEALQLSLNKEVNTKDMIASVKKDWTKQKHKISEIKSIELYVKPEDYAVYYVINGEHTGKVWL